MLKRLLVAGALLCACGPARAETVRASWYGGGGHERLSRHTASGERFDPRALTAAHRTLPFGTRVRVCRAGCVVVRINDRGPFVRGRSLDLSRAALLLLLALALWVNAQIPWSITP